MNKRVGSMYPNINIAGPVVSVLPSLPTPQPPRNHIWQFAQHYIPVAYCSKEQNQGHPRANCFQSPLETVVYTRYLKAGLLKKSVYSER